MKYTPWISVRERLPCHLQKVLFCYKNGKGLASWYDYPTTMQKGDFFIENPMQSTFRVDCHPVNNDMVACWMPYPPEPPKSFIDKD